MPETRFLFVPSVLPSGGFGHVARCQEAARMSGGKLWAPEGVPPGVEEDLWTEDGPDARHWDMVVLDRRASDPDLVRRVWAAGLPAVGWDEGGKWRHRLDYLVDTLGNLKTHAPNLADPGYLDLGPSAPLHQRALRKVLLAFGGNDAAGLASAVLELLAGLPDPGWDITLLEGPWQDRAGESGPWGRPLSLLRKPPRLKDLLPEWDLVFCSYGLTALECLRQGVPFLVADPGPYHAALSRRAGYPCLGTGKLSLRLLRRHLAVLEDPETRGRLYPPLPEPKEPSELWKSWRVLSPFCPACGHRALTAIHRAPERTYARCAACGFLSMKPWRIQPRRYHPGYFHEEYERQYGRTYLDDFDHIKAMGRKRLYRLQRLSGKLEGRRLLDIGCAFGPFLAAATDYGVDARGLDISPEAAAWVRTHLGLPAAAADFLSEGWEDEIGAEGFDIVSLWYVIEHFPDLRPVLERLQRLVRGGGWLLLSTPNAAGLTARFHPSKFFQQSPDDHFTLWTPQSSRKLLSRYGFSVKAIVPTGIHPQRLTGKPAGWWGPLAAWGLRRLGWGDTMEIYARRDT